MPLQVKIVFISCDFMAIKMEENAQIFIFLGWPFLVTTEAMIDVKNKKLSLQVREEKFEFILLNLCSLLD